MEATIHLDQKAAMHEEARDEHRWLQRLVGEWTYESRGQPGPDQPPVISTGTETVRSLDGLWIVCEARGTMDGGGSMSSLMSLGYDPARGRFVGTFIGGMMTHLWLYEGERDGAGRILTLYTDGPSFSGDGGTSRYRDTIELRGDDERVMTSSVRSGDGAWMEFMTAHYRRAAGPSA